MNIWDAISIFICALLAILVTLAAVAFAMRPL